MPFNTIKSQISEAIEARAQDAISRATPRVSDVFKETVNYHKGDDTTTVEIDNNKFMARARTAWKYRDLADLKDKANIIGGLGGLGAGLGAIYKAPSAMNEGTKEQAMNLVSVVGGPFVTASGIDRALSGSSVGDVVKGITATGVGAGISYLARPTAVKALPIKGQLLLYGGATGGILGAKRVGRGIESLVHKSLLGPKADDPSLALETKIEALNKTRTLDAKIQSLNPLSSFMRVTGLARKPEYPQIDEGIIDRMKAAELQRVLASLDYKPTKRELRAIEADIDHIVTHQLLTE